MLNLRKGIGVIGMCAAALRSGRGGRGGRTMELLRTRVSVLMGGGGGRVLGFVLGERVSGEASLGG